MIRLAQAHRVTSDVDEVVVPSTPTTADLLVGGRATPGQRVYIADGVGVDLIEVGEEPMDQVAQADLPDLDDERIFLLAHDFALRSAEVVPLQVFAPAGVLLVECVTTVATASALFATKLQSAPARAGSAAVKRGSDVLDAFMLLDEHGPVHVANVLRTGPHDLHGLTARLAERLLVNEAERTVRWAKDAGTNPARYGMTAEAVRDLAEELVARLQ